jgi:asparagine synthase (glutamine-hydrolysing)
MLESIAHRGPDDQHSLSYDRAVLGARRLSILDLAGGRQPLVNEDGTVAASNNGEIYNYLELRSLLIGKGHRFRTDGDTEVIAHAYEEFGLNFVDHLRGMFAIAIWDARANRLVLARDRLGKKPIYWTVHQNRLVYGSELKTLLQDPTLPRIIDQEALGQYLQFQYVPAPRSILKGIRKLPPASILTWDGREPTIRRYWSPSYEPKDQRPEVEQITECRDLLRESVQLRLRSDVPVGIFLSGGMDSSAVTALASELAPIRLKTFSIGFQDSAYNELPYARRVADAFDTDHVEDVVALDAIDLLPELVEHFDEPFADSSALPTFRVAQLASQSVKVVLTGDGGDEAFGGYRRYVGMRWLRGAAALPRPARILARRASLGLADAAHLGPRTRSRLARGWEAAELSEVDRYVRLMSIFRPDDVVRLQRGTGSDPSGYLASILNERGRRLDRLLRTDLLTYLPEDLLVKMDRATMANSLEARSPILDHRLIEFAATLPESRKITGRTTKAILRKAVGPLLPPGLLDRPKMGFAVPIDEWFRGQLGMMLEDLLRANTGEAQHLVDPAIGARFLAEHRRGYREHGHRLWALLMLELWARRWLRSSRAIAA